MILYFYIAVTLLLLFWVAEPLLRRKTSGLSAEDVVFRERVDALLKSLRQLHDKHERESMLENDFEIIERRLMLELARLYERKGVDPSIQNAASCDCGSDLTQAFSICPGCGRGLKVA